MFLFTHILNASTGERFWIKSARLDGELNETPTESNWYELSVFPEWEKEPEERNLTLIVPNNGGKLQITKNLSDENYLDFVTADALIEGKTLITVNYPEQTSSVTTQINSEKEGVSNRDTGGMQPL